MILRAVCNISCIYTDGNSSYRERFSDIGISALHIVAPGKPESHIRECNISIRGNLARFKRRSKRFSKTLEMLDNTLLLFFNYKKYKCHIK